MEWPSTWRKSVLLTLEIEPTAFAHKALALWQKSTPLEPWTRNPLGVPAVGSPRRTVTGTKYAIFPSYAEFNRALATALGGDGGMAVKAYLSDDGSISKLWRAIADLKWPASETESDYPAEIQNWMGETVSYRAGTGDKRGKRSSGTTGGLSSSEQRVMQAHRAMVTATQAKLDLASAINFIVRGVQ